jgi:hypothetical protein
MLCVYINVMVTGGVKNSHPCDSNLNRKPMLKSIVLFQTAQHHLLGAFFFFPSQVTVLETECL